jgi:hypothetical protein
MTLNEVYKTIDDITFSVYDQYDNRVIEHFKELQNDTSLLPEELRHTQVEIDVQNFIISDNKLGPTFTGTDSSGKYFEYPSLNNFEESDYEYLIKRIRLTKNSSLRAKYCHLLWLSPKKRQEFAVIAIKEYYKTIKLKYSALSTINDNRYVLNLRLEISNSFYLSVSTGIKKHIEQLSRMILRIAKKFNFNSEATYLNIGLIDLMLNNPRFFKPVDFIGLEKKCFHYAVNQQLPHSKIDILILANMVSQKINPKELKYIIELGKCYEEQSHAREKDSLTAISFCQSAIKYYKKARKKEKLKELNDWYSYLKNSVSLGAIKHEFDVTDMINEIKKRVSELLKKSSEYILSYLMYSNTIFPTYDFLYNEALKQKNENSFTFLFASRILDEEGNTISHYIDENEKILYSIMHGFDFYSKLSSSFFLQELIFRGVQSKKISAQVFIEFIHNNLWLGKNIVVKKENVHNWLDVLAPGLNDFFSQIHFYLQNPSNTLNHVLAIDSLVIKVEGILRNIYELRGIPASYQEDQGNGKLIDKQKDINTLLREDNMKSIISKDDLLLFQFVLIDKAGWNLRNKVSHTLIRQSTAYSIRYILFLVVIILKLGKNEYSHYGLKQAE